MKYYFYAKRNVDYSKYGFHYSDGEWTIWRQTKRITIKRDYSMSFNCVNNEILTIFMEMVKDDVVIAKKRKDRTENPKTRYMYLTDEECALIQERRKNEF